MSILIGKDTVQQDSRKYSAAGFTKIRYRRIHKNTVQPDSQLHRIDDIRIILLYITLRIWSHQWPIPFHLVELVKFESAITALAVMPPAFPTHPAVLFLLLISRPAPASPVSMMPKK